MSSVLCSARRTCDAALSFSIFFFNDAATAEIYTLSLHDALPISVQVAERHVLGRAWEGGGRHPVVEHRVGAALAAAHRPRSEEHTSELQSQSNLVCRLLLEKKKKNIS